MKKNREFYQENFNDEIEWFKENLELIKGLKYPIVLALQEDIRQQMIEHLLRAGMDIGLMVDIVLVMLVELLLVVVDLELMEEMLHQIPVLVVEEQVDILMVQ